MMRYVTIAMVVVLLHSQYCNSIATSPHASSGAITGISIVGERHSGTNLVRDLLKAVLDHRTVEDGSLSSFFVGDRVCGLTPSSETNRHRFKHRFQFPDFNTCNLSEHLVIVMLRNPFDWTKSMKRHCWCRDNASLLGMPKPPPASGPPPARTRRSQNTFEASSLVNSTLIPWITTDIWSQIPPLNKSYPEVSFLGNNRKPGSYSFDNILHLRACKMKNHLDIKLWAPNVVYFHQEDTLDLDLMWKWIRGLVHKYSLPRRKDSSEPALARAFGDDANTTLANIWNYIDGEDEQAVPAVKISYLGSMGKTHKKEAGSIEYDPGAARSKSLWLNHEQLIANDSELRQHVLNVNRLMKHQIEERAGYHQLEVKGLGESTHAGPGAKEEPKVMECGW